MAIVSLVQDVVAAHLEAVALLLVILLAAGTVALVVLDWRLGRLLRRYQALVRGTAGESLEGVIEDCVRRVRQLEGDLDDLKRFVEDMHLASRRHVQGLGVVRFNAFQDTGGDQSFALALLDGAGDGVVVSSLYGRNESRVYAKPVEQGSSRYALTAEEQQAVDQALRRRR
ncbi:MAG: DUF4446 family protein [Firmicutes bacterium]|nr:DUF4446 family protein [Bacillota bacterium]